MKRWVKAGLLVLVGAAAPAWADAKAGAQVFQTLCAACHVVEKGVAPRLAPNLFGVVGRKAASTEFGYTPALKASKLVWKKATIEKFVTDPGTLVPGTAMVVRVKDAQKRKDLVDYLATLK